MRKQLRGVFFFLNLTQTVLNTKLFQNRFVNSYLEKKNISFILPLMYFILELSQAFCD